MKLQSLRRAASVTLAAASLVIGGAVSGHTADGSRHTEGSGQTDGSGQRAAAAPVLRAAKRGHSERMSDEFDTVLAAVGPRLRELRR
ncbi:hypothetical protein ACWD4T_24115, partial [Streptomyces umbrinus]